MEPRAHCGFKRLHEDLAHIAPDPLVEDVRQESAPLLRRHAARRDARPLLVGTDHPRLHPFDGRDELDPADPRLVAQKAVDRKRGLGVGAVDGDEDVGLDPVPLQKAQAAHYAVEGRPPAFVPAVAL